MSEPDNRRPLKSRGTGWARALAKGFARAGVTPDAISAASVVFAAAGAAFFWLAATEPEPVSRGAALVGAAVSIQLRLLCNLLDGMVAVEHGKGGTAGPIWNELPDRVADALFLVGAGYAAAAMGFARAEPLGWACAVLAVLTAYIRELGRSLGLPADFSGPMAKPHRMAALTVASLVGALEPLWGWRGQSLVAALALIAAGAALTAILRTGRLARRLKQKGQ